MTIDVQNRDGVHIVRPMGELTAGHEMEFIQAVTDLFSGPGVRILIDLHHVSFMDSTGLGAMVRVGAQANVQEGRLVLASPSPFIEGVLQTTQLDRFFRIHKTTEEALRALA